MQSNALREYAVLDTTSEPDIDELVALSANLCGTRFGAVTVADKQRFYFFARHGFDLSETDREAAFCDLTLAQREVLVVEDADTDARVARNGMNRAPHRIRFYAGVPLLAHDGSPLGALCVFDREPKALSDSARATLRTLGRQAGRLLEFRRLRRLFADSQSLSKMASADAESARRRALTAESEAIAFSSSLTDCLQGPIERALHLGQELLAEIQESADPSRAAHLGDLVSEAGHLSNTLRRLQQLSVAEAGPVDLENSDVLIRELVEARCAAIASRSPEGIDVICQFDDTPASWHTDRDKLADAVDALVAFATSVSHGTVRVRVGGNDEALRIEVRDAGEGMSRSSAGELFDWCGWSAVSADECYHRLGLRLARAYAGHLGGELVVATAPGLGTIYTLTLLAPRH